MDPLTLVSDLATEMLRKSGVREWEEPEVASSIAQTAATMALEILGVTIEIPGAEMANAVYYKTGTPIIFGSEVGDDVAWSNESIADNAGRQSSLHDQGADGTARPHHWRYRIYAQCQATPTLKEVIRWVLKTSDGTHPDNDDGASDAAVSAIDKLSNLFDLVPSVVDEAAANIEFVATGVITIDPRHFGVVMWNTSGATITADASEAKAIFTPYYAELQ